MFLAFSIIAIVITVVLFLLVLFEPGLDYHQRRVARHIGNGPVQVTLGQHVTNGTE